MRGKKRKTAQSVTVQRPFLFTHNGMVFRFAPGQTWKVEGSYPGEPQQKQLSPQLFSELKPLGIFK